MARKRFADMDCAAAQALEQIGDWWTLLIVREAFFGTTTFSGFLEELGIARNILTDRLNTLVDRDILLREPTRPDVERFTYALTPKGHDLLPILVALMQWGDKWHFGSGAEPLRITDAQSRRPIRPITVTSADGRTLALADLHLKPGPGAQSRTLERFKKQNRRSTGQ